MKSRFDVFRMLPWLMLGLVASAHAADPPATEFDRTVAPLLIGSCLECHSGDEPQGGLDLSRSSSLTRGGDSGPAVVPGKAAASLLWKRVESGEMPPENPLAAHQRDVLREWIESGARWGSEPIDRMAVTTARRAGRDWWAFQPIERPSIPMIEQQDQVANPIDAFIVDRLQRNGLEPSPPAQPRTLVRRLFFDLVGLPPDAREIDYWSEAIAQDGGAAIERLVTRLLASGHYGERWGRHWLDVVRFGESQGFERDRMRPDAWHYRQWVIDALNRDLPYDEFVRLQIAGDVLMPDDASAITATGFLVAGPWDEVGQNQRSAAMRAVVRQDELEDYIGTTGQSFLGLTLNCARCHDHKFDPISQEEYYRVAAALAGVAHGSREVMAEGAGSRQSVYAVKPSSVQKTFVLHRGNPASPRKSVRPGGLSAIDALDADFGLVSGSPDSERRRRLAAWLSSPDNPLTPRVIVNRLWHYHFGSGLVATPNDLGFNGGRPSHPKLLDWLAAELIRSGWSLKRIHRLIVTSRTYQQASRYREQCGAVDADNRWLWRKAPMRLEAESLRDAILAVSGQLNRQFGGAPYRDFETTVNNSQFYRMVDPDGADASRRTVYRTWLRSGRNHLLDTFDCPDPSTTAPRRAVTTTPIQSLTLMNSSFVLRMSDRFADRVAAASGVQSAAQADLVYAVAYGRPPDRAERRQAARFIESYGLPAFCRVILNSNEFIYVD